MFLCGNINTPPGTGKNFPENFSVAGRFFRFKARLVPADNSRDANRCLKFVSVACRKGHSETMAVEKEGRLILERKDCVFEIGKCDFSVTQISKEMVCFFRGDRFLACGQVTGRLNFGRGVSFSVSGSVSVLKDGQAVLRDVRVPPPGTDGEDAFWVSGPLPPVAAKGYGGGKPARRCA